MKVVVAGGAGFLGSHLVDRLLAEGHTVDVFDDLSSGSLANLANARSLGGELKFHNIDAAGVDVDSVIGLRRPEVVYQLALMPRGDRRPAAQAAAVPAMVAMLEAAARHGVRKIVTALPASALYGRPAARALPVKEGELIPRGVRGVVGRALVDLLGEYRERQMLEFTALAMATVYGPRQRPDAGVVAAFVDAARHHRPPTFYGDGRQTRDLLFVDDAVDALVRAGERGSGLLVNIGTGVQTSLQDLWDRLDPTSSLSPRREPGRPDDLVRFAVSSVRARLHLGWAAWTDLDNGLARLRAEE